MFRHLCIKLISICHNKSVGKILKTLVDYVPNCYSGTVQIVSTLYSKPLLGTIKNSSQPWESWGKNTKILQIFKYKSVKTDSATGNQWSRI